MIETTTRFAPMSGRWIAAFVGFTLAAFAACAQSPSPYAGETGRDIKALSADEVRDYLDGKGIGLARAAELNGYPGPLHVLELAGPLALSADQRTRTQALFEAMRTRAVEAGRAFIDAERELDRLFRSHEASEATLGPALERVARRQAEVRRVHLEAHLDQVAILTPDQLRRYAELRGYASGAASSGHDPHRHR